MQPVPLSDIAVAEPGIGPRMVFVAAESFDAKGADWIDFRLFESFEQAIAHCTARTNYCLVYRHGKYTINGSEKSALIMIHWNAAVASVSGPVPETGTGYPRNEDGDRLVTYVTSSLIEAAEAIAAEAARVEAIVHRSDLQLRAN